MLLWTASNEERNFGQIANGGLFDYKNVLHQKVVGLVGYEALIVGQKMIVPMDDTIKVRLLSYFQKG